MDYIYCQGKLLCLPKCQALDCLQGQKRDLGFLLLTRQADRTELSNSESSLLRGLAAADQTRRGLEVWNRKEFWELPSHFLSSLGASLLPFA